MNKLTAEEKLKKIYEYLDHRKDIIERLSEEAKLDLLMGDIEHINKIITRIHEARRSFMTDVWLIRQGDL